jgi:hypothetical protein
VVTGVVGATGLVLKEHRQARDAHDLRERALSEATSEVAFVTDWWKAHQLLGGEGDDGSAGQALAWLAEAQAKVASTQHATVKTRKRVTLSRLFLMHPLHRPLARMLRGLFWLSVAILLIGSITIAEDAASRSQRGWLSSDIAVLIIMAAAVLILHAAAEAAESNRSASKSPATSSVAGASPATSDSSSPRLASTTWRCPEVAGAWSTPRCGISPPAHVVHSRPPMTLADGAVAMHNRTGGRQAAAHPQRAAESLGRR